MIKKGDKFEYYKNDGESEVYEERIGKICISQEDFDDEIETDLALSVEWEDGNGDYGWPYIGNLRKIENNNDIESKDYKEDYLCLSKENENLRKRIDYLTDSIIKIALLKKED